MPHHNRIPITHLEHDTPSKSQMWLDVYLPTQHVPIHLADPRFIDHVGKVKETLDFIKWRIDIRSHLVALAETGGRFCISCGLYSTLGTAA